MTKIKPNSWEHYCHLLATHQFNWTATENTKQWLIDRHMQEQKDIQRLMLIYDERGTMYNQYNPKK